MSSPRFEHQAFLKTVPGQPGVYRMYDSEGDVIYVGKAKNLKKRLSSYFRENVDSAKTQALVARIAHVDVTVVNSEKEAFVLENNFIKKYRPRYNVVLRDDKSYPFIFLSAHAHPRLSFHRGAQKEKGEYFGPYPSAWSVREGLRTMQRLFPVRQCEDSYYRARSRPCLQYQMKRCAAPCVNGYISDEDYALQVEYARLFLQGKNDEVIERLVARMEEASIALNFEAAARFRDQISALRHVSDKISVTGSQQELDVFGMAAKHGAVVIQGIFVRNNQLLGNKSFFPTVPKDTSPEEVMQSFLLQFYLAGNKTIPKHIVLPIKLNETDVLLQLLAEQAGHSVTFFYGSRDEKKRYLALANKNAENARLAKLQTERAMFERFLSLEEALDLGEKIKRMECFDISHTSGQQTVASCVVFNREGPLKNDYRLYNITDITPGDDYAAMAQALKRRFKPSTDEGKIPDILFIDGGKGQLAQAEEFFDLWKGKKRPMLMGVAKGVSRKPGLETLIVGGTHEIIALASDSPGLHLIQHIRDESHRFAITGHRQQRAKVKRTSTLESIPGIGAKKRQALLKYLGGLQGVKRASKSQLAKVPGVSIALAEIIYDHLHA